MPVNDNDRRDPLQNTTIEPSQEIPQVLRRRSRTPAGRQTPIRPTERRRRNRQLSVTFSDPDIPDRIRALARKWDWIAPDKTSPATSDVVEFLLMPRLNAAEAGDITPQPEDRP